MRFGIVTVCIACAACGRLDFDLLDRDAAGSAVGLGLAPGDTRLVHGVDPAGGVLERRFTQASATWTQPVQVMPPGTAQTLWTVPRVSPLDASELIAIASFTGSSETVDIVRGPADAFAPTLSGIVLPAATAAARGFDVAYEARTGTAVVVYVDGTAVPKYRRLAPNATTWSAEAAVPAIGTASVSWVELESRRGTDELALVFSDNSGELWALTETAGVWDAAPTLIESLLRADSWQNFAAAYGSVSGNLLVVWGHSQSGPMGTAWSTKPAGQPGFGSAVVDPNLLGAGVLALAPDPASDQIAIGFEEYSCGGGACDDAMVAMWDGSQIISSASLDADTEIGNQPGGTGSNEYGSRFGSRPVAVNWLGTTGTAVYLWGCATSAGQCTSTSLDWAMWRGGAWSLQPEFVPAPPVGDKSSIELLDLGSSLLAVFTDVSGNLWAKQFDGTAWHDTEGGAALDTTVGAGSAQPFGATSR